ncbi:hypothetical protein GOBAR_AA27870 [Gossypium barbadense]|uniref:Uncharacterized protein n=1 Tax=Gossypium barbadense TaxID=3634 RepID=A0A2P5WP07_GOSBA|nr:hypothetical protein GOBAR_AA27870 [Gossypium barbadense]
MSSLRGKKSVVPASKKRKEASSSSGRRESTGVVNTDDVYFLWCMSQGHIIDLAYFIPLVIQHQTERHRKGVITICPYMTRLVRHFGILNTPKNHPSPSSICQYLHISSPVPPREPSSDEDD